MSDKERGTKNSSEIHSSSVHTCFPLKIYSNGLKQFDTLAAEKAFIMESQGTDRMQFAPVETGNKSFDFRDGL